MSSPKQFFTEVKVELLKASWPWDPKEKGMKKYKELVDSTVIVVVARASGCGQRLSRKTTGLKKIRTMKSFQ